MRKERTFSRGIWITLFWPCFHLRRLCPKRAPLHSIVAGVIMSELVVPGRINLEEPRYDQSTYSGRAKHFFITTNPLNLFASGQQLDEAKALVERYRWMHTQCSVFFFFLNYGQMKTAKQISVQNRWLYLKCKKRKEKKGNKQRRKKRKSVREVFQWSSGVVDDVDVMNDEVFKLVIVFIFTCNGDFRWWSRERQILLPLN